MLYYVNGAQVEAIVNLWGRSPTAYRFWSLVFMISVSQPHELEVSHDCLRCYNHVSIQQKI